MPQRSSQLCAATRNLSQPCEVSESNHSNRAKMFGKRIQNSMAYPLRLPKMNEQFYEQCIGEEGMG